MSSQRKCTELGFLIQIFIHWKRGSAGTIKLRAFFPQTYSVNEQQLLNEFELIVANSWDGFKNEFFSGVNFTNMASINYLDNFLSIFTFKDPHSVLKTRRTYQRQVNNSKTLDTLINEMFLRSLTFADILESAISPNFLKMDMKKSFKYFFSSLWFSRLPCYDVPDITGDKQKYFYLPSPRTTIGRSTKR